MLFPPLPLLFSLLLHFYTLLPLFLFYFLFFWDESKLALCLWRKKSNNYFFSFCTFQFIRGHGKEEYLSVITYIFWKMFVKNIYAHRDLNLFQSECLRSRSQSKNKYWWGFVEWRTLIPVIELQTSTAII